MNRKKNPQHPFEQSQWLSKAVAGGGRKEGAGCCWEAEHPILAGCDLQCVGRVLGPVSQLTLAERCGGDSCFMWRMMLSVSLNNAFASLLFPR